MQWSEWAGGRNRLHKGCMGEVNPGVLLVLLPQRHWLQTASTPDSQQPWPKCCSWEEDNLHAHSTVQIFTKLILFPVNQSSSYCNSMLMHSTPVSYLEQCHSVDRWLHIWDRLWTCIFPRIKLFPFLHKKAKVALLPLVLLSTGCTDAGEFKYL